MVMLDHMDDCLTPMIWESLLERLYWCCKESEGLVTIVLMPQPLDDAWRHNYFVPSICSTGKHSNVSERSWTLSLPHRELDLVEILEDGLGYAGFLKHSRVYTRVPAQKTAYGWLLTIFGWFSSLQHSCCAVWYLWWYFSSHNSVSNVLMKMPWWSVGGSFQDVKTKGEH